MSLTCSFSRYRQSCYLMGAYTKYLSKLRELKSYSTSESGETSENDKHVSPLFMTSGVLKKLAEPRAEGIYKPPENKIAKANEFFRVAGKRAFLQTSAYKPEQSPDLVLPEVAFLGRTSVGKSSLINAVLNTKKLVRTSKKPGQTRLVNFFNIDKRMYLVDLPGYGYAPGKARDGYYFVKVAEAYLQDRKKHKLRNICVLIDGEVGVKKNDLIAFEMLEEFGIPYQVKIQKFIQQRSRQGYLTHIRLPDPHQERNVSFYGHADPAILSWDRIKKHRILHDCML